MAGSIWKRSRPLCDPPCNQAGASALTQLLRYDPPDADHRTIPCPCGSSARYKELRSKTVLTVLGSVELRRPYYACADCSKGQYPADAELGVAVAPVDDIIVPARSRRAAIVENLGGPAEDLLDFGRGHA